MKKIFFALMTGLLIASCTDDLTDPNKPVLPPGGGGSGEEEEIVEGLNYVPEKPDADQELKITFKAGETSALYGYEGDVYLHTGVIVDGQWQFVPADWNENKDKCKLTKLESNVWSITLSPTIREWYGSGTAPVQKLGILIRSAEGDKKGIDSDSFVTVSDSKYSGFVPGEIKTGAMPAGMVYGINVNDNSSVTLVLYDQNLDGGHKDYAHVVGDFNDWTLSNDEKSQMIRDDAAGCWWITLTGLDASKEYAFQYYVGTKEEGGMRLADAYAEKILDPDNDKYIPASTYSESMTYPEKGIGIVSVFRIQKEDYAWKESNFKIADKSQLVIYELLLRDFTDSGDLNGAMTKLDYLENLGVNAIELMPVQEFDGNDSWGYNPCFFFAMDKAYGTRRMYKEFIDACHQRGIAVLFDVVYNHATGNNTLAKLYWDANANKTASNNPWFNVDAPHPFSVFHDFNHQSLLVRQFVKRNLQYLLDEYKIDGFRFDLTKGFTQRQCDEATASNYDADRIAVLKEYNAAIKEVNPDAAVILEHFCEEREESELSKDGMLLWRNLNNAYCQSAMGYKDDSDFSALTTWNTTMASGGWVGFMESHDEERMAYKQTAYSQEPIKSNLAVRMKRLATNAAFCFTVSGPKMIWQFGELGYDFSLFSKQDGLVGNEDNKTGRKPIRWDYFDNSARKDLYATYNRLLTLRTSYPQLFSQEAFKDWKVTTSYWDQGRFITLESVDGKKLVVAGNFTNNEISPSMNFPASGTWYDFVNGGTINVSGTQNISVPAHEYRLYTNFQIN